MSSLTEVVGERLRTIGYEITRSAQGGGVYRLEGVDGWCVLCDEAADEGAAAARLVALADDCREAALHPAVVVFRRGPKAFVLHADLVAAAASIRLAASGNRAARATTDRVLARAEKAARRIQDGRQKVRGCLLPLEQWMDLLLSWRVMAKPRLPVPPMPRGGGTRVGSKWIAYDYHAVRLAQIEEEWWRGRAAASVAEGSDGAES